MTHSIHFLLQPESHLDSIEGALPVVGRGLRDVQEDDPCSSHVLVLHEVPGVLVLLLGHLLEEVGEAVQGDVVTVKVCSLLKRWVNK